MRPEKFGLHCYYLFFLLWLFTAETRAYVDPSVLTYAIQAVAGVAITLGTFAGLYGRKLLKLFRNAENNQNFDPDADNLEFHDPKNGSVHRALAFLSEEQLKQKRLAYDKSVKKQSSSLVPGILVTIAVSFLWMMYSPLMLYLGNVSEFRYDFASIVTAVFLMFAVGLLAGCIVFFISNKLSKTLYSFLIYLGFAALLITLVQGVFLADGLPSLDGTKFDWSLYSHEKIKSYILCAVVLLGLGAFHRMKGKKAFEAAASVSSVVITVFLSLTILITGLQTGGFASKRSASVTVENEFLMSEDQNFIILVLDATDSGLFRQLMETENPEYKDVFEDFTYYPNTVGCYTYTEHAIPFILSGIWMENQEEFVSFETKAMDQSPLFSSLQEKGYRMGMYEDALVYESEGIYRFENVKDDHFKLDSIGEYARQSMYMTWFQYMPYPLKPLLSHEDALSNLQNRAVGQSEPFLSRNTLFYDAVREGDVSITDDKCFRFIHLEGAHVPFRYDRDANEIPMEEGSYIQNIQASVTITDAYLNLLKKKGVYDNSSIIIMADHGFTEERDPLLGRSNPVLLIKGVNEKHPLNISEQPVSYEDLQQTYQLLLGKRQSNELYDFDENTKRERRFLSYDYNHPERIDEYIQEGYAADIENMRSTGNTYVEKK